VIESLGEAQKFFRWEVRHPEKRVTRASVAVVIRPSGYAEIELSRQVQVSPLGSKVVIAVIRLDGA
jgi:hypothetical protein